MSLGYYAKGRGDWGPRRVSLLDIVVVESSEKAGHWKGERWKGKKFRLNSGPFDICT